MFLIPMLYYEQLLRPDREGPTASLTSCQDTLPSREMLSQALLLHLK